MRFASSTFLRINSNCRIQQRIFLILLLNIILIGYFKKLIVLYKMLTNFFTNELISNDIKQTLTFGIIFYVIIATIKMMINVLLSLILSNNQCKLKKIIAIYIFIIIVQIIYVILILI